MNAQHTNNVGALDLKALSAQAAALRAAGRLKEAEEAYRRLVAMDGNPAVFNELCSVLMAVGRSKEALDVIDQALTRHPDHLKLAAQRGVILERLKRFAEAMDVYDEVLVRDPNLVLVISNLAGLLNLQGRHDEAIDLYRSSLARESNRGIHSNLLLVMNYGGRYDQRGLFAEHKRWAALHAPAPSIVEPFTNVRDPNRRLRVGYVSPDFNTHPVAFFIGAVIANHDRNAVEVFCYSSTFKQDRITNALRGMNMVWRDIAALDDASAARLIREDGIDIAVDLSGHTAGNRLLVLARRPAPIQATYLGYPNTTGMGTIDYRFTDAWADPMGESDRTHTEVLIRLPGGFLAYTPPANMPPVRELPARAKGHVTFGSFNNLAKVSPETIDLWSRVLAAVPDAQLMIKARSFVDPALRERFSRIFAARGVSVDRLLLRSEPIGSVQHYDTFNSIDIALDTVPYNGTTTTCEALWMGVPVVALAGDRHASRVGVSILNAAGLPELIAPTPEAFVVIAHGLASDLDRLAALRASLRARLVSSALLDVAPRACVRGGLSVSMANLV